MSKKLNPTIVLSLAVLSVFFAAVGAFLKFTPMVNAQEDASINMEGGNPADGDLDPDFVSRLIGGIQEGTGIQQATVKEVALQPDGKIIIGGNFLSFASRSQSFLARLNADGSPDYAFFPAVNGRIEAITLQSDGKILIGGDFTQVNGQARMRAARLNSDGTLDTTFQNPGANNLVLDLVVQSDGRILVGGEFDNLGGQTRKGVGRLTATGALDTSFTPPDLAALPRYFTLAVQQDGRILVGGDFFIQTSVTANSYIGRLNSNGTVDTSYAGYANARVFKIRILPDGKHMLSGQFSNTGTPGTGGIGRTCIARFNSNGTVDTSFRDVNNIGATTIEDFRLQSDGRVVVGGTLSYQSFSRGGAARLESDGTLDTSWDPNFPSGTISAVVMQPNDKVLLGGNFSRVRGQSRYSLVRLNTDASLDLFPDDIALGSLTCCSDGRVKSIITQPDGKILVGTFAESAGGLTRRGLVRLNLNGTIDTGFQDPGIANFETSTVGVAALALQPDGKILAGGDFRAVNGAPRRFLVRLNANGSLDTSFNPTLSSYVTSIAVQPDGKIMIGGFFSQVDGQDRNRMARLNSDGSLDQSFNRNSQFCIPYSIDLLPNGQMLACGSAGSLMSGLARYNSNGSLDTTFTTVDTSGASLTRSFRQADGKIIVIGTFSSLGGISRHLVARLNANGTVDTSFADLNFGSGSNSVSDAAIQPDGRILIVGSFLTVNGQSRRNVARLNSDGSLDPNLIALTGAESASPPEVSRVWLQQDGRIILGGDFRSVNRIGTDYIARLLNGFVPACSYAATPPNRGFAPAGGVDSFVVTATAGCAWTATSNAAWLTVTSGATGSGNGLVTYAVAQNTTTAERSASITVNGAFGQTAVHTVTQAGAVQPTPTPTPTATPTPTPGGGTLTQTFTGPAVAIPDNNAAGVNIVLPVSSSGTVGDLNFRFDGTAASADPASTTVGVNHSWLGDLVFRLTSPAGTTVTIFNRPGSGNCPGNNLFNLTLDDEGGLPPIGSQCPGGDNDGPLTGSYSPANALSVFDGQPINGNWTLNVSDNAGQDVGSVRAFSLIFAVTGGPGPTPTPTATPTPTPTATPTATPTPTPTATPTPVPGQPRTAFDYDGDGRADISIFRESLGDWYLQGSTAGFSAFRFGFNTDRLVPADYDGDRRTDIAVYRPSQGTWFILNTQTLTVSAVQFGLADDIPTPADFDGDGRADIGIYRPSNGTWFRTNSSNGQFVAFPFGVAGDKPVPQDFDGDGRADYAVYRPSNGIWFQQLSATNTFYGEGFGAVGDTIVPGDYDGDRKADLAVYRPSNGTWFIKGSITGNFTATAFGGSNDQPAAGDYDGDGRFDICVFRGSEGQWYRLNSSNGMFDAFPFGLPGDRPTHSAFY